MQVNETNAEDIACIDLRDLISPGAAYCRLYLIGQLHGAPEALDELDKRIIDDLASGDGSAAAVIHAGDYIDKGPRVPELLDRLCRRTRVGSAPAVYLAGAHEWMLRRAVCGDGRAAVQWLLSGAEASLSQWRVPTDNWVSRLPAALPRDQLDFLKVLPFSARLDGVRFVSSSFHVAESRPFGLLRANLGIVDFPDSPSPTAIGRCSEVLRGRAPAPWLVREVWRSGKVACAVLEHMS